ncbi:MAG: amidohydrolase family protein [Woeseiaceae bacterium]|nr:amidohydrolase family protein [Woeseiaceae bacterium]
MKRAMPFWITGMAIISVSACGPSEQYDVVIERGHLMDPDSGLDAARNIGIVDGKIVAIGSGRMNGALEIDARGLIVAPGFIDLHAHGQTEENYRLMVQDGVTSGFELEVGSADVAGWYSERAGGQVINYGVSSGHIPVRMKVFADQGGLLPSGPAITGHATLDQVNEMKGLLEQGLREGAVAVGFGLAYTPAATTSEFETMLRVVADHGTSAHIHVAEGLDGLQDAIDSAAITAASMHVVHANSSGGAETAEFLEKIDTARTLGLDITTEAYPYEAGMTSIQSALFDGWESWDDDEFRTLQWPETGEMLTRPSFTRYREQGGFVIMHSRTEEMTRTAIASPLTMIASDGLISDGRGHPRTSGTFSKVLGKFVREDGVLTLMDALGKMTIRPARRLENYVPAMRSKGRLQVGADADITIFDATTVIDRATYRNPTLPSEGIQHVLVNGVPVVVDGELLPEVRAGKAIRVQ